jgi:pimeloyl-ACP methyl ester carboxylesterase
LSSASAQTIEAPLAYDGVVRDIPLQSGGIQRVLYSASKRETKGVVVMFAGGTGELDIDKGGHVKNAKNFVVRSSDLWRERGYGIVLVDALDHQSLRGQRSSAAYAEVTRKVLAFAHEQASVPVWVLGTSQGSIAAMNAASHAGRTQLAGLILTESVSILGGSHETVFDAHPDDVRVPSLVVANVDDQCKVALPSMAREIAGSLRHAPTTVLTESGGVQRSRDDCASLSPHGYYGIEEKVVDDIVAWMQKTQSQS